MEKHSSLLRKVRDYYSAVQHSFFPRAVRSKALGQEPYNLPSTAEVTRILQIKCLPQRCSFTVSFTADAILVFSLWHKC